MNDSAKKNARTKGILQVINSPLVFFAFSLFIVETFFTISLKLASDSISATLSKCVLILSFLMFCLVITYVFVLAFYKPKHLVLDQEGHIENDKIAQKVNAEESYAKQYRQPTERIMELEHQYDGDENLAVTYHELRNGNVRAAVQKLFELSQKDPKYFPHLISALVVSPALDDWSKAEKLIKKYGKPEHFRKLAFNYWTHGDLQKAISLSEKALKNLQDSSDEELVGSIKNSLAYYYADADRSENASYAYQLAESEVERRGAIPEDLRPLNDYEDALDTLGYVKISFGETISEVRKGIDLCTQSLVMGGNKGLFQKHYE